MALIQSTAIPSGATDYEIDQSLKFDLGRSTKLTKTFASAGNRKTWTWSSWVKRNTTVGYQTLLGVGNVGDAEDIIFFDTADARLRFAWDSSNQVTMAQHRDTSGWYHLLIAVDSTESVADDRIKIYINGNRNTEWYGTKNNPTLNHDFKINNALEHYIGVFDRISTYANLYMGETNFIDGQQLTPADFGETGTYGEWKPIEYSGTYGTNGFYLPFKQDYTVEGFSAVTYRGTGADHYIGGIGFSSDLTWIKRRTASEYHVIFDTVRGLGDGKALYPNANKNEGLYKYGNVASSSADGIVVATGTSGTGYVNQSGESYVAWNWDMGGSNASNTDGSITSTVRANPTYGQSIVSWTNPSSSQTLTVGHGLGVKPDMIIMKGREEAGNWFVYHKDLATLSGLDEERAYLKLNTTDSTASSIDYWADSIPTTSLIATTSNIVGGNSKDVIAYCFASKTGYSKFGTYTGDATTNGSLSVTTGFAPAFLMVKRTNSTGGWVMVDNTRNPSNPINKYLQSNVSDVEASGSLFNFTSTGFNLLANLADINSNGGTYIYMAFADNREYAYWLDQSGNNNDWTSNNLTESDISVDSPTNNFATFNPLRVEAGKVPTFSEGNLKAVGSSVTNSNHAGSSSMAMTTGKWYAEFLLTDATGHGYLGIVPTTEIVTDAIFDWNAYAYEGSTGKLRDHGTYRSGWGATFTTGDLISIAVDLDNSNIYFAKNNVWQNSGVPTSGATGTGSGNTSAIVSDTYEFAVGDLTGATSGSWHANFGQDSSFAGTKTAQGNQDGNGIGDFYYTPPTGFLALCTKNLPDATVTPSENFNTVLYTGNGGTNVITGVGFQSDWTWIKQRSNADSNVVFDAVRGVHKRLVTDATAAEADWTSVDKGLDVFSSDGFTVKDDSSGNYSVNKNSGTFVAWNWKANGSGSSNTDGTITSTVSANVDAGFSIVSYSGNGASAGATVGHGLSKAPELILPKNRGDAGSWHSYHIGLDASSPEDKGILLNATNAVSDDPGFWNDTAPTASVFTLGTYNVFDYDYIAYCFHSVDGYSKVGSYTGNGNANGTFVYTGFRPAFVMVKNTTNAGEGWLIVNNKTDPINPTGTYLSANSSYQEQGTSGTTWSRSFDFTANGFKLRGNSTEVNENTPIIYIAFAETPFKNSNAR